MGASLTGRSDLSWFASTQGQGGPTSPATVLHLSTGASAGARPSIVLEVSLPAYINKDVLLNESLYQKLTEQIALVSAQHFATVQQQEQTEGGASGSSGGD